MSIRTLILAIIQFVFRVLVLPFVLFYWAAGRSENAFQGIMQVACLVPASPGVFVRQALLAWMAAGCGRRVTVHIGTLFSTPRVRVGENVYVGAFCNIGYAQIEDDVLFGSNVHVLSGKHQHGYARLDVPMSRQQGRKTAVCIGAGAWIGNGAIVMADVGEHSIVGAGSVVVDAIPAWSVAVGSPARVVGDRRAERAEASRV
jgi:acetyltransferase-like isoleucine patch superfamily enzyme